MTSHWNDFNLNPSSKRQKTGPSVTFSELPSAPEISEESTPDILQVSAEKTEQSKTLMVAETSFFNQRNKDFWHRNDLSHLRPYDFPYIRALLQQPPQDTLSPEDTRHKEQARSSIEVVTRAYEEKFLREPIGDERACVMNENCQGNQLPHITDNKFTLREFLLPSEDEEAKRS